MRLLDFVSVGAIKVGLSARTKESIVNELAGTLITEGKVSDKQALIDAILRREECVSTAIGEGVCIPHAKVDGVATPCIAIGLCPAGIEYQAPDAKSVKIVFLIVSSPKDAGAQLKILACLARYVKTPGFVQGLEAAQTPQDVINVLTKFEQVMRL